MHLPAGLIRVKLTAFGSIVPPPSLPVNLYRLEVVIEDADPDVPVDLQTWNLPTGLVDFSFAGGKLVPCPLPRVLQRLSILVQGGLDMQAFSLPSTLESIKMTSLGLVRFDGVEWPVALQKVVVVTGHQCWDFVLPDTLTKFIFIGNTLFIDDEEDQGPISFFPVGYTFPDRLQKLRLEFSTDDVPIETFEITRLPSELQTLALSDVGVMFSSSCNFPPGLIVTVQSDKSIDEVRHLLRLPIAVSVFIV